MNEAIKKTLDRLEHLTDYDGRFEGTDRAKAEQVLKAFAQAVLFQGLRRVKRNVGNLRPTEYKGNALIGMSEIFDALDAALKETE